MNAVSVGAEEIFGPEQAVIGQILLDLVTSPMGDAPLREGRHGRRGALARAGRDAGQGRVGGGMLAARVSTCGPPRAALVTVEPSGFGRPR